jgi:hypothetical protein
MSSGQVTVPGVTHWPPLDVHGPAGQVTVPGITHRSPLAVEPAGQRGLPADGPVLAVASARLSGANVTASVWPVPSVTISGRAAVRPAATTASRARAVGAR